MAFPIGFLVLPCGGEQAGGMIEDAIRDDIALKAECVLDAEPRGIYPLVQQVDDMEVAIADDGSEETSLAKPACI